MNTNENNTPEIIDSYELYNLYRDSNGFLTAEREYSLYVEDISFFDNSFSIQINESITNYSDWEDCRDEVEEAFRVAEYFQEVINSL